MIADSAVRGLQYAEGLVADIPANQFSAMARLIDGDGRETVVDANHPAFIFGHLALYPSRIVEELGGDASAVKPDDGEQALYSRKVQCVDDPAGGRYEAKKILVPRLMERYRTAIDALRAADDDRFRGANPNEAMRGKFPTIGAMHAFYVGGHFMIHMGQISTWRRVMGLGSI